MDLNQLRELLDLVREHELTEFEIEHEGLRLKVRKDSSNGAVVTVPVVVPAMPTVLPQAPVAASAPSAPSASPAPAPVVGSAADAATEAEIELAVVKSPIVGTFYRSPEPGAASFV